MGEQNILREYLISLGFKVDGKGERDLGTKITDWDKRATKLSRALVGVAAAAAAMVGEFAFRMERLYYASKLADSAADNLQALDFAGQQSGIKNFTGLVQNLARAIRLNPGIQGLIQSLGIPVEGRDRGEVLKDIIRALDKMPEPVAAKFANLFGIDPDSLHLLRGQIDELEKWQNRQKEIAGDLGVDQNAAVKSGRELAQEWRDVAQYILQAKNALIIEFLPQMHELAGVTKSVLADWITIVQQRDKASAGVITPRSAAQAGLTVAEQKEMAVRAADTPRKTWTQMTPEEREANGLSRDKPFWGELTPQERKKFNMPEKEEDLPLIFSGRFSVPTKTGRALDSLMRSWGVLAPNAGAAELSSQSKERLGIDRTRNVNPANAGWFMQWKDSALDAIGYRSRAKIPVDPAAIDAVNKPVAPADPAALSYSPESSATPDQARQVPPVTSATPPPPTPDIPIPERGATVPPVPEIQTERHPREEDLFSRLESSYKLPSSLLDYIWKKESTRGRDMLSPKGAKGHFGFMDGTAKQYNLKDPSSLPDSAKAAATYMHDLMQKYNGDLRFALAAYNWGPGNLDALRARTAKEHPELAQDDADRYVLGHMPIETRKYVAGLDPADNTAARAQTIEVKSDTKIEVHGVTDSREVARQIEQSQKEVAADIARNFADRVR